MLSVLPDPVKEPALAGLRHPVERRHLVSREAPAERACVLLRLGAGLGARDRNRAFADQPIQRDLRRRLAAVSCAAARELGEDRLDLGHRVGGEVALARWRIGSAVLAGETDPGRWASTRAPSRPFP